MSTGYTIAEHEYDALVARSQRVTELADDLNRARLAIIDLSEQLAQAYIDIDALQEELDLRGYNDWDFGA